MHKFFNALLGMVILCALGCSGTVPVAVIGQHGEAMRGTYTVRLSGGRFSVTNGKVTCTGSCNV